MLKCLVGACALFALTLSASAADWGCTNVWEGGKLTKTGTCVFSVQSDNPRLVRSVNGFRQEGPKKVANTASHWEH